MKVNKIGNPVRCPACGWRDPKRYTSGKYSGWLKCRNPDCGLTWHEDYREDDKRGNKNAEHNRRITAAAGGSAENKNCNDTDKAHGVDQPLR